MLSFSPKLVEALIGLVYTKQFNAMLLSEKL
jgi:hypothetical protein